MKKIQNAQSLQKLKSFDISKYYKNETDISNTTLNSNCSNHTSLKRNKQLNVKNTLSSLLEDDNISFGKFTLYDKTTKNSSLFFDLSDENRETNIEGDKNNEVIGHNQKYQNECESSDISD